jgi:hypothetical protein
LEAFLFMAIASVKATACGCVDRIYQTGTWIASGVQERVGQVATLALNALKAISAGAHRTGSALLSKSVQFGRNYGATIGKVTLAAAAGYGIYRLWNFKQQSPKGPANAEDA